MKWIKSLAVLGTVGVLIMGLASPATAAKKTAIDVRGDAPARLDITKVNFRHTAKGAFAKIHVRNLRQRGQFVFAVANRRGNLRFGLVATGRAGKAPVKRFYKYRNGNLTRKACRAAKVTWRPARDIVTIKFPVRCYRALPKRVVMNVATTRNFPKGRTIDQGPTVRLRR